MIDMEAITREDLIARLGTAVGLLAGICASYTDTDSTIKAFLDSAWKSSKSSPVDAKVDERSNVA